MILAAQNQKQTNTGGLTKLLKLKIGAKLMLTVNVDIQDRLIYGQTGNIKDIAFDSELLESLPMGTYNYLELPL